MDDDLPIFGTFYFQNTFFYWFENYICNFEFIGWSLFRFLIYMNDKVANSVKFPIKRARFNTRSTCTIRLYCSNSMFRNSTEVMQKCEGYLK